MTSPLRRPWGHAVWFFAGTALAACSLPDEPGILNGDGGSPEDASAASGGTGAGGDEDGRAPGNGGQSAGGAGSGGAPSSGGATEAGTADATAPEAGAGGAGGTDDGGVVVPPNPRPDCTTCTPTPLVTRTNIVDITLGGPLIYFVEVEIKNPPCTPSSCTGPLYRISTSGSAPESIVTGTDRLTGIVVDGSYVYGTTMPSTGGLRVSRAPILGDYTFTDIQGGGMSTYKVGDFLTNSSHVFVASTLSNYYITRIPKGGGTANTPLTSNNAWLDFDVDETDVYVVYATSIARVPTGGGSATPVAGAGAGEAFRAIDLTATDVAFVSATRVGKVTKSGGEPVTLNTGAAYSLITDAKNLYFFRAKPGGGTTCSKGSDLYGVPLAGGTLQHLATDTGTCTPRLLQDNAALYWLSGDRKSILKITKTP